MANRHSEWVNMTAQQIIDRLTDSGYTLEEIYQVAECIAAKTAKVTEQPKTE